MNTRKKVSVQQIIDAMIKNGYVHETSKSGTYIHMTLGREAVQSACIIGQAALNLEVYPGDLEQVINEFRPTTSYSPLSSLNDSKNYSYQELVEIAKSWFAGKEDQTRMMDRLPKSKLKERLDW